MKIRLCHLSDSHYDETDRLEETIEIHREIVERAAEAHVDAILHAGDVFNRKSTPAERLVVRQFLREAAEVAPVVIVKGNHDAAQDLAIFDDFHRYRRIRVIERPTEPGNAWILDGVPRDQIAVLALPWFDRAHLVAGFSAEVDAETSRRMTIDAARELLSVLAAEASRVAGLGLCPILVGHVMVAGSETGTGFIPVGTTVELSPHDIADVGAAYAALGHVHKAQDWLGGRVAYSGSPRRCNFGEPEQKGFRLVTIEGDPGEGRYEIENVFVPLRSARRIELLSIDLTGWPEDCCPSAPQLLAAFTDRQITDALVRLRYRIRPESLHRVDEAAIEVILRALGAYDVKIEAVLVHEARVRSTEIVSATSTWEKVLAYWSAKQIDVPEATRARVRQKLDEIERGEVTA